MEDVNDYKTTLFTTIVDKLKNRVGILDIQERVKKNVIRKKEKKNTLRFLLHRFPLVMFNIPENSQGKIFNSRASTKRTFLIFYGPR